MGASTTAVRWLTDYDNPRSVGSRLRARRSSLLIRQLSRVHASAGKVSVIDVGGTRNYWNALPEDALNAFDVHVTVVNLPGESHPENDERFSYVDGDGCDLHWVSDQQFDIAHSNSVLEHVGQWNRMKSFAGEIRRVAHGYVVQTPYFWFPVEPHFMAPGFHWLPESVRAKLLMRLPLGHSGKAETLDAAIARVQSAQLVDAVAFRTLFPDATIGFERVLGMPKSLIAVRNVPMTAGNGCE